MASCLAKIGLKRPRKRENNNYRYVPFLPDAKQKIPKKQEKKFKNTVMYSFQGKIGLIKRRKRENKNHRSVPFLPDV